MAREFIGVRPYSTYPELVRRLKSDVLLFDRIGVSDLTHSLMYEASVAKSPEQKRLVAELESLIEKGIVFKPETGGFQDPRLKVTAAYRDFMRLRGKYSEFLSDAIAASSEGTVLVFDPGQGLSFEESNVRLDAALLSLIPGVEAVPILPTSPTPVGAKADIVQVVVNALPTPADDESWERILEFRADTAAREQFARLRDWMNDMARGGLTPGEVEDRLEAHLADYREHMRVHKMKVETGMLETVVIAAAEWIEDLSKFNWGKLAKGLFAFKHRQINLLESELKAPGRAVAFVDAARAAFGTS
jgi:hypothetical protein